MKNLITCLGMSMLVACASNPNDIDAAYVSPLKYKDYDCDQLAMEMDYVGQRTTKLYQRLKDERKADNWQMGVGLVMFWPALYFLEGGDGPEAAEYAKLKGEFEALRDNSVIKKCGIETKSPEEIIREAEDADKADAIDEVDEAHAQYREKVVDIAAETRCVEGISLLSVSEDSEIWMLACYEVETLKIECDANSCAVGEE